MRVTRFTSSTPIDDKRVAELGERLAGAFSQMPGYVGWSMQLDSASGTAAAVTYWADAESMQASEDAAVAVRGRVASEGVDIRDIRRVELLIQESVGAPQTGLFARITSLSVAPEQIDALISEMKAVTVPQVKAQPGFRSFLVSANREMGQVAVASIWESDATRDASNESLAEERRKTMERFGASVQSVENMLVVGVDIKLPATA